MAQRKSAPKLTDRQIVERVQSILINAALGRRSLGDDSDYPALRGKLKRSALGIPSLVHAHPSVDSFSAFIRTIDRADREQMILRDFAAFESPATNDSSFDASAWTGIASSHGRLRAVRHLLPLAQVATEGLIDQLSQPNPNGGPPLDHRLEAIEHLRELHRALGELLAAAEAGHLDDELGQGLAAEVARFGKLAAKALKEDPMPYLTSALLLGLFSACGLPGIGGYLSGVALTLQKRLGK